MLCICTPYVQCSVAAAGCLKTSNLELMTRCFVFEQHMISCVANRLPLKKNEENHRAIFL